MENALDTGQYHLRVGGLSRTELMGALDSIGVFLNCMPRSCSRTPPSTRERRKTLSSFSERSAN